MTTKVFFVNEQTNKKYLVTRIDQEKGEIWLKGQHKEFKEDYSKERFTRLGYKLVREEVDEQAA